MAPRGAPRGLGTAPGPGGTPSEEDAAPADPGPVSAEPGSVPSPPMAPWPADLTRVNGPLHGQIAAAIAAAITSGRLRPGTRLGPERQLAAAFGVNRLTLRQALADLERQRLIRRSAGRRGGTFVAEPTVERDLTTFAGFSEQARRDGLVAGARVLRAELTTADRDVAAGLELAEGDPVLVVGRLRLANGRPVLLECSSFPAVRFPGMLQEPLDGSLYQLLGERYGARPCRARESLEPVPADGTSAPLLEVARGAPLLAVERVAFDAVGVPVEFARDLFRGDRIRTVVWSFDIAPR
jgi:DNA-binding GntR family transcriptional regulator